MGEKDMGIMEDINKKDNLPGILSDVANAFIRAGTDDLEDELKYFCVGAFGKKEDIDIITKRFSLWK